jgi:single-strand DNA-binding protein
MMPLSIISQIQTVERGIIMVGLNKMTVIGRLGRDPEMRYTTNGNAVTSFSVATSRTYTDSNSERREETEWFTVSAWNQLAENCNQYLTKGQLIYVEGRLKSSSWVGNDGQTRFRNENIAREIHFLNRPTSDQSNQNQEESQSIEEDDLPF